jgi:hypothetical protein
MEKLESAWKKRAMNKATRTVLMLIPLVSSGVQAVDLSNVPQIADAQVHGAKRS